MTNYEETYLDRIKALKSQKKITNNMLSDLTGIPLGTLSKLLAGISDSPKLSNIVSIANALGCSLDWLISGVPENNNNYMLEDDEIQFIESYRTLDEYGKKMVKTVAELEGERVLGAKPETAAAPVAKILSAPRKLIQNNASLPPRGFTPSSIIRSNATEELPAGLRKRPIPLFDMPVSAGSGVMLTESTETEIIIPDMPRTKEADYALRIYGDSMEPRYHSGDIVLVQNMDYVPEGELGIFILDGSGYFKKYDGDRLLSLNPKYPPILLKDFTDISCAGRVIGKLKRK